MRDKLSCVVTLHREGVIAHRTLKSIVRALLECRHIDCEIIVVLDNPDQETIRYIERTPYASLLKCLRISVGDPALARNYGISMASGSIIAILDGDDLISANWLTSACAIVRDNRQSIVHPEWNVSFGEENLVWRHPDQKSVTFDPSRLLLENFWSALSCASKAAFLQSPYVSTKLSEGIGYEDWHWNCEVIANGFFHTIAQGTVHFIRIKRKGSRNSLARQNHNVVPHSSLFDNVKFWQGKHP